LRHWNFQDTGFPEIGDFPVRSAVAQSEYLYKLILNLHHKYNLIPIAIDDKHHPLNDMGDIILTSHATVQCTSYSPKACQNPAQKNKRAAPIAKQENITNFNARVLLRANDVRVYTFAPLASVVGNSIL
jgi:hypothetical protein